MKKIINMMLIATLLLSLAACGQSGEIEVTKEAFPTIQGTDMALEEVTNDLFADYDATIVNFWNNGCGTCIEEMPELEEYYLELQEQNINLIGVASDSDTSEDAFAFATKVLGEKGVTYMNISPDVEGTFYTEFIENLTGYPTTYVVDSEGNIIGNAIVGNVKNQDETLRNRLDVAVGDA